MLSLQKIDDISCLPRVKQLDSIELSINRGQYSLVTAPPKSGTTTFLKMVERRLAERYPNWLCGRLDLADEEDIVGRFANLLMPCLPTYSLEECYDKCYLGGCFVGKSNIADQTGSEIIVLLDSLDCVSGEEQRTLLRNLRDVYYKRRDCEKARRWVFVIAGAINLSEVDSERTSPFYAGNDIQLPDFTIEETRTFISQFLLEHDIVLPRSVELYLYDVTSGHPHLLATLCQMIIHRVPSGGSPPFSTVQMAVADLASGRDELLNRLKDELQEADSTIVDLLVRILSGSLIHTSHNPYLMELMRLGVVCPGGHGFVRIRNPIFECFLRTDPQLVGDVFGGKVASMTHVAINTPSVNELGFQLLLQVESSLRTFVACKLFAKYGEEWPRAINLTILNELSERRGEDHSSQREPLLCYAELSHLRKIVISGWESVFQRYFVNPDRRDVFFDSLRLIRNKIAHSRNLSDTELSKFEAVIQYFYEFMAHGEN
jgi:hypothetical protein